MAIVGIEGGIFGSAREEFDRAASVLGLDRGIWQILSHPQATDYRLLPHPHGQR